MSSMFGGGGSSLSVGAKARVLEAVAGEKQRAQFLAGTCSLQQPNKLHLLEVDEATEELRSRQVFRHEAEVLSMAPSPEDSRLLATCGAVRGQTAEASLWRLPQSEPHTSANDEQEQEQEQELTSVAAFPPQKLPVSELAWSAEAPTTLASAHETLLRVWRLDDGSLEMQDKLELDTSRLGTSAWQRRARALAWDPHSAARLAFAVGGSVRVWDLRVPGDSETGGVELAHPTATLSLSFNPNRPQTLVTGGDDGALKFWDLRAARRPLLQLPAAHTHWVWSVRFHPQHDQLVLSGGSDAALALWRVSSISSAPLVELDERDLMDETAGGAVVGDTLIHRAQEHEDAVYATRWATAGDVWSFASLSMDGRVALGHVPSTEKYKILL